MSRAPWLVGDGPLVDPSIPRKDRSGRSPVAPQLGWFVDIGGGELELRDRWGRRWSGARVSISAGGFGGTNGGTVDLPRPFKYAPGGTVLVEGDQVIILFLEGDDRKPTVIGGFRATSTPATSSLSPKANGPDRKASRWPVVQADSGVETACVEQAINDSPGVIKWTAGVGPAPMVGLTVGGGKVSCAQEVPPGVPQPVILGTSFLTQVQASLTEIQTGLAALGIPTTQTAALVANIATSLGAGAPYLSSTLETD